MTLSTLFGGDGPRIWTVKDMEDPACACNVCGKKESTKNQIYFCDGCDQAMHATCGNPGFSKGVALKAEEDYFCLACEVRSHEEEQEDLGGR